MKYISQTIDFISYTNGEAVDVERQIEQYYLAKTTATPTENDADWLTGWVEEMPNPYGQKDDNDNPITCYVWKRQKTFWNNGQITYLGVMLVNEHDIVNTLAKNANQTIGQWCVANNITFIDGATITTGTIDASKITTGILQSSEFDGNTNGYANKGSSFNLDTGEIRSKTFRIDGSGNAYFKGSLTSPGGSIGGWSLSSDKITKGNVGLSSAAVTTDIPDPIRIYAGNTTASRAPFRVTNDGDLFASSADITGKVTSDEGEIGGWTIDEDSIHSDVQNSSMISGMSSINEDYTDIGQGTQCIENFAFAKNADITEAEIPFVYDDIIITQIGYRSFQNCSKLESVVIPSSITDIGSLAFDNCSKLTHIYYTGTEEQWNAISKGTDWDKGTGSYTITYGYSDYSCAHTYESLVSEGQVSAPRFFAGYETEANNDLPIPHFDSKPNFLVLEDGSLYANAAKINGHIEADSGEFHGDVYIENGQIGGLQISENNISSGDGGLSFTASGLIIAQQLEINDYFKANTFQVGTISGRNSSSSVYLDFESTGKTSQLINVTLTVEDVVNNEKAITIDTGVPLVNAKTFVISSVYNGKNTIGATMQSTRVSSISLSPNQQTWTILVPAAVTVSNPYGSDYYCTYSYSTVSPQQYTEETANEVSAIASKGSFIPGDSGEYCLGFSDKRWKEIWCTQSAINSSSDRNEKNSIELIPSQYESFFDTLQPVRYKFNVNDSNRYHIGFISQDVRDALQKANISTFDFAGYLEYDKDDGSKGYGLRYGEFISLNTYMIQKLKRRVTELEAKNIELEERLARLEALINTQQND